GLQFVAENSRSFRPNHAGKLFGALGGISESLLLRDHLSASGSLPNDSWTQITALVSSGAYNYSDSQIFVMMIEDDRLQGVREQLGDWTGLNIPSLGGIPAGA